MNHLSATAVSLFLFAACSSPSADNDTPRSDSVAVRTEKPSLAIDRSGYYADTLPCADCPGVETKLWVRDDGTFVLQQHYIDRDTLPIGTVGEWHLVNELITIGPEGDKPDFYRRTPDGLLLVDEMGVAAETTLDYTLDRLADATGDDIPRMRLSGTFSYWADSQSFQPCGSRFNWPCVGGMDAGEGGGPLNAFNNLDLQKLYRKAVKNGGDPWIIEAVCILRMGPAAEGDGADEYIHVGEVTRTLEHCP